MNSNNLLDAICLRGVLTSVSIRYWRGCKRLDPEDLGLNPTDVDERLIQLGQKRLVPREFLSAFSLMESRAHALVEKLSFPFLGGLARFVPNPALAELSQGLDQLRDEFGQSTLNFVAGYGPLREKCLAEWREAADHFTDNVARLLATIEAAFPPVGHIAERFGFDIRMFQIAAPEHLRIEVAESITQLEMADERRRIASEASRKLQGDLDRFIAESVTTLREETVRLASDVLSTLEQNGGAVHQRTLNRLTGFIESFRTMNFADDQTLENSLNEFRQELLNRTAEEYRQNPSAVGNLTAGLNGLRENALTLVHTEGQEIASRFGRFGRFGGRKLAIAG